MGWKLTSKCKAGNTEVKKFGREKREENIDKAVIVGPSNTVLTQLWISMDLKVSIKKWGKKISHQRKYSISTGIEC